MPGFRINRDGGNVLRKIQTHMDASIGAKLCDLLLQKIGEAGRIVATRIDRPDHLAHPLRQPPGILRCGPDPVGDRLSWLPATTGDIQLQGQAREGGTEVIMQVPRDSGALVRQSALLLFNDAFSGDGDFDDMVVRVTISSVPEPEALAMLLAGLGVVTAVVRRRRSKAVSSV